MKEWKVAVVAGAMTLAGVVAGALLFGHREAQAQQPPAHYRTCFIARQESVDVNNESVVETPGAARLIAIPDGWTVVTGSGVTGTTNWIGGVVLCR